MVLSGLNARSCLAGSPGLAQPPNHMWYPWQESRTLAVAACCCLMSVRWFDSWHLIPVLRSFKLCNLRLGLGISFLYDGFDSHDFRTTCLYIFI